MESKTFKTKVVKNSLEPQWNETLSFANLTLRDVLRAPLRLALHDQATGRAAERFSSKDALLGELSVSLQPLEHEEGREAQAEQHAR